LPDHPPDGLQEKRYVTAILRLLLDKRGKLVHGEVADLDGTPGKRFDAWTGLVPAICEWLIGITRHGS